MNNIIPQLTFEGRFLKWLQTRAGVGNKMARPLSVIQPLEISSGGIIYVDRPEGECNCLTETLSFHSERMRFAVLQLWAINDFDWITSSWRSEIISAFNIPISTLKIIYFQLPIFIPETIFLFRVCFLTDNLPNVKIIWK